MDPLWFGEYRLAPQPVPLTPLIGSEYEAAAALTLLRGPDIRFLTVTGTDVGNTRLARPVGWHFMSIHGRQAAVRYLERVMDLP